jgi:rubrerythrin
MVQALDIVSLIEKLASIEEEGASFYESLGTHAENEKIRRLAQTMARVERGHQKRFEKLAQTLSEKRSEKAPGKITASVRQYIHTLIDHRIFQSPAHAEKIAKKMTDVNEAVDMAIQFEKDNILLLIECGTIAEGKARELIKSFVGQEKAHIRSLQRIRAQLASAT